MATRLTRAEQVERNRELVLDAARRVFLERGYAKATIDAIASEAGFSTGVVYSQFAGKADLLFELLERRIAARAAENAAMATDVAGLFAANSRHVEDHGDWLALLIEFSLLAARDPELGARYRQAHARTIAGLTEVVASVHEASGRPAAFPPRVVAQLVLALEHGAVIERAIDPHALPAEQLERVHWLLLGADPDDPEDLA